MENALLFFKPPYRVRLEFNDGTHGVVNLSDSFDGQIFKPLKNLDYFKSFKLEGNTLTWENEADFATEYLKSKSEQGGAGTATPRCG